MSERRKIVVKKFRDGYSGYTQTVGWVMREVHVGMYHVPMYRSCCSPIMELLEIEWVSIGGKKVVLRGTGGEVQLASTDQLPMGLKEVEDEDQE